MDIVTMEMVVVMDTPTKEVRNKEEVTDTETMRRKKNKKREELSLLMLLFFML